MSGLINTITGRGARKARRSARARAATLEARRRQEEKRLEESRAKRRLSDLAVSRASGRKRFRRRKIGGDSKVGG